MHNSLSVLCTSSPSDIFMAKLSPRKTPVPQILMQEQSSCISWFPFLNMHCSTKFLNLTFAHSVCIPHHRRDHTLSSRTSYASFHDILGLDHDDATQWKSNQQHWFLFTYLVLLNHIRVARSTRQQTISSHCLQQALVSEPHPGPLESLQLSLPQKDCFPTATCSNLRITVISLMHISDDLCAPALRPCPGQDPRFHFFWVCKCAEGRQSVRMT